MITSLQLNQVKNRLSKIQGPIMPSDLPGWKIDYNGMLAYAKEKGVTFAELSDEERVMFIKE